MMTSSMAASFTSSLATESNNRKKNNEETQVGLITIVAKNIDASTETNEDQTHQLFSTPKPNPIEKATKACSISSTNSNASASSKIPYPLQLIASKTNQLQRSASLRLRGTKSNLLQFNTSAQRNSNSTRNTGINPKQTEQAISSSTITTTHNRGNNEMQNEMAENQSAHNVLTTGRVSPRREFVLNSTQFNSSANVCLTRSVSLKSKQNNKTDFNTEELCTIREKFKDLTLEDNASVIKESPQPFLDKNLAGAAELNALNFQTAKEPITNGGISQEQEMLHKQDIEKMSLNLNGTTSTIAATIASVTTATAANARPSSLITTTSSNLTGNSPTSKKFSNRTTTNTSVKPKTPTSTTSPQFVSNTNLNHYRHHHPHHQHHHQHFSKQYQQALPSVPETKQTPKTPPVTPDSPSTYLDDDLDSLYSFATTTSGRSTMSCEHPYVARNGTTFSGRKMKYVVHCSNYAGQVGPDYLTPTQRAQRQIKRLKELLCVARQDLEKKDSEILRLTREVVELRLFKASLSSPEDRSASSDAVTVREAELKTSQDVSPIVDMVDDAVMKSSPRHVVHGNNHHFHHHQHHHHNQHGHAIHHEIEMQSSFADSGHFEDMTSSSIHSKDSSYAPHTHDMACGGDDEVASGEVTGDDTNSYEVQRQELISMYEQRIEELIRTQDTATSEMKRSHNDKVEALLQKLAECNTRYADIVPDYEHAKERIRELEKQLEDLQRKLAEHEEKQNKMYLHMYQKGQEAERIARADQALELAHRSPNNKVSINELLHQLQSTQDELENIRAAECRNETGGNHALLTAKEAISLWVLGARKTIYRRLLDAQKNRTHVDPEVTLQFLKSAVYYFLTDKENSQGHLQAIESILEFTEAEKQTINRAHTTK